MFDSISTNESTRADAETSGLRYLGDDRAGISRRKHGNGFAYVAADGTTINDPRTLARIKHLAIPPAWTDIWISPAANGHLQATGRDARGRKQYRYHAAFRAARDKTKYGHTLAFGSALEKIRARVKADIARDGLPREKVVATIVKLLDTTLIRVGNDEYARTNGSFGLTTLRDRHVYIHGDALRFEFRGKSGKTWHLKVHDRRVARIVKSCQDLPGQHLFQYVDENGDHQSLGSHDVNAYLREVTGQEITAKDFRTFAGTVMAATVLLKFKPVDSATEAKANIREAIEEVAGRLGNTPAICRKCYIHPEILSAYLDGALALRRSKSEERAVLGFLKGRLKKRESRASKTASAKSANLRPAA
jgi:DNA topoisomerase-1